MVHEKTDDESAVYDGVEGVDAGEDWVISIFYNLYINMIIFKREIENKIRENLFRN